jgi:hypothetical protein
MAMAHLEDDAAAAAAKSTACAARANHRTTNGARLDAMTNFVFFKEWNLHLEVLSQVTSRPYCGNIVTGCQLVLLFCSQ